MIEVYAAMTEFYGLTSLSTCSFSTSTSGTKTVPAAGCTLSQMITLSGDMEVVGEGNVLRELHAVGGIASPSTRHFLININTAAKLTLKFLKLIGGKTLKIGFGYGGSIYINGTSAVLDVEDSTFAGCGEGVVCALRGGAVFGDANSKMIFKKTTFEGNRASSSSGGGGAIHVQSSCVVELTQSTFISNVARNGGAIRIQLGTGNSFIKDCTFKSNTANGGYGGAMYNYINSGSLAITATKFEGNSANYAGAVYLGKGTTTFNAGITFLNNEATTGSKSLQGHKNNAGIALFTTCTTDQKNTFYSADTNSITIQPRVD